MNAVRGSGPPVPASGEKGSFACGQPTNFDFIFGEMRFLRGDTNDLRYFPLFAYEYLPN